MTQSTEPEDAPAGGKTRKGRKRIRIKRVLLLGFAAFVYFIFTSDFPGEKFEEYAADQAPTEQLLFLDIVRSAIEEADAAANDAAETTAYIKANRALCDKGVFDAFGQHTNWVGLFSEADVTDANDKMYVEIYAGLGNKIRAEVPPNAREAVLSMSRNNPLLFSGTFKFGNMAENQCIRTTWSAVFGSSPELEQRTFLFSLTDVTPIPEH